MAVCFVLPCSVPLPLSLRLTGWSNRLSEVFSHRQAGETDRHSQLRRHRQTDRQIDRQTNLAGWLTTYWLGFINPLAFVFFLMWAQWGGWGETGSRGRTSVKRKVWDKGIALGFSISAFSLLESWSHSSVFPFQLSLQTTTTTTTTTKEKKSLISSW